VGDQYDAAALVEWLGSLPSKATTRYVDILHNDARLRVSLGKIWQVLAGRARWIDSIVEFEFEVEGDALRLVISWQHARGYGRVRLVDATHIRWVAARGVWETYAVPDAHVVAVVALRS
jgi:hypothetical protein